MEDFSSSAEIQELSKALLEFQKLEVSVVKNTTNSFLKNKYADLGAYLEIVMPAITKCGLIFNQFPSPNGILSQITHAESGQFIRCFTPYNSTGKNSQEWGSLISYFRRYSLAAIFSLYADDDDGNQSSGVTKSVPTKFLKPTSPEWSTIKDKYKSVEEVKQDWIVSSTVLVDLQKIFLNKAVLRI